MSAGGVLTAQGLELELTQAGKRRKIFAKVDLELRASEVVSLLGPSGAGKSSLLRVLAGLRTASAGRVELDAAPLAGPSRKIALAFQSPALLPWLNVEDNVALGLQFEKPAVGRSDRRERAREALAEVGLADARSLRPRELSGGMAQRAALARCLVRRPEVLLLDEPFSALDEITRAQLHALLRRIVRAHATATLLVTHSIDEALLLSDRILVLGGEPATILERFEVAVPEPRAERLRELEAQRLPIVEALACAGRNRLIASPPVETPRGEPACVTTR
ncbi:MAG TPA: ABC transporter ATP-binding protein [Polyangiales bacterium]|nr:ABC transporter ATP-binding protein [Polyangiales bacterium]